MDFGSDWEVFLLKVGLEAVGRLLAPCDEGGVAIGLLLAEYELNAVLSRKFLISGDLFCGGRGNGGGDWRGALGTSFGTDRVDGRLDVDEFDELWLDVGRA